MRLPASDVDPTELVLSGSSSVELLSFSPRFYTVLFLTSAFHSNNIRSPPRSTEIKRSLDKSLNKIRRSKAWDYAVWGLICSWIWRQEKWKEFFLRAMRSGALLCGCKPVFRQRDRPRWPWGVSSVLSSLRCCQGPRLQGPQSGGCKSVLVLSSRLTSLHDVQNKMAKAGSAVAQARGSLRGAAKADGPQPGSSRRNGPAGLEEMRIPSEFLDRRWSSFSSFFSHWPHL